MRKSTGILLGSVAMLAVLSAPVLAKSSGAQKADEKSAVSSTCSAYEQAPDGSWTPRPCQAIGADGQTQRGPTTRGDDDANN